MMVSTGTFKAGATVGALLPVAAAAAAQTHGPTVEPGHQPVIWYFFGSAFEAGSMIAALCACLAVRFYVVQTGREHHRWTVDLPVTLLVMMFSAAGVMRMRPDPSLALMIGTGFGALGAGVITIALGWIQRTLPGAGQDSAPAPVDPAQIAQTGKVLRTALPLPTNDLKPGA